MPTDLVPICEKCLNDDDDFEKTTEEPEHPYCLVCNDEDSEYIATYEYEK